MNRLEKYEPTPEFRITVEVNDFARNDIELNTGAADEIVVEKTLPTGEVIGYALNIEKGSEITSDHALLASLALTKRWRDMRQASATKYSAGANTMPQFSIPFMAAVTVTNVNVRSELHGDGHVPAADIWLKMSTSNQVLTEFDTALRAAIYKPAEENYHQPQAELDGIDPISDLPLLRCASIEQPIKLKPEFVGYTLEIDRGLGMGSNIFVDGCSVNKFRADCKEGGTVDLLFRVQASGLKEDVIGKLATLIGSETRITLTPPEERQAAIDGTVAAFKADVGGGDDDATDAFVKAHA